MQISAYTLLFILTIAIFLFCYFVATRVWIKVDEEKNKNKYEVRKENRRDFLQLTTISIGGIGTAAFIWPFIKSMNPAEDTLALGSTEVDLSDIEMGEAITVKWRGKPVFIRRRTLKEISEAKSVDLNSLKHPENDQNRVQKEEWLVVLGVCTHLGCVPLGQKMSDSKGEYNGWFCPCHGSHYDSSGRIRKGPAPENLPVPPYTFLNETKIKIG